MLHRIELMGWSPTQLLSNSCTYGKRKTVAVFSRRLVPFLLFLFIGTTLSSPFSHPGGEHTEVVHLWSWKRLLDLPDTACQSWAVWADLCP